MPKLPPPTSCPGTPVAEVLPAGTGLVRVHSEARPAIEFNLTVRGTYGRVVEGGRFDSVDGSFACLYAATDEDGAFAESFARDLDYSRPGPRPLGRHLVNGRVVSEVHLARDASLVGVDGAAAQQLGQDDWLTHCNEADYPTTRQWAAAIRSWVPGCDGLVWLSKRDPTKRVFVLWGDRSTASSGCGLVRSSGNPGTSLEHGPARLRLDALLARWRLYIEPGAGP